MNYSNKQEEEEEDLFDHFDRLPDALLRLIFNRVHDAKSLTRCLSVSKRFSSIIPETDTVSLTISPPNSIIPGTSDNQNPKSNRRNFFKTLINKFVTRPLQFLHQIITPKSTPISDYNDTPYQSPNLVLNNFKEIKFLQIELPCHGGELGSNGDVSTSFLKWKAEFGKELESCVILGATSFQKRELNLNDDESTQTQTQTQTEPSESVFTNDELKLRVVWTISCLMAASARHYLLQEMVSEHGLLERVEITDACKQGRLCMRKEQIVEMRSSLVKSSVKLESQSQLERTRIPDLKMKLWYVSRLELPESGFVMNGATLVVIRPVADDDGLMRVGSDDNDDVYSEALREIMKMKMKKTYVMEMNSF